MKDYELHAFLMRQADEADEREDHASAETLRAVAERLFACTGSVDMIATFILMYERGKYAPAPELRAVRAYLPQRERDMLDADAASQTDHAEVTQ